MLDESSDKLRTSVNVPVPITAHSHLYDIFHVHNKHDAVSGAQDLDEWDNPSTAGRILENLTVSKTKDRHVHFCVSPDGS